MDEIHRQTWFFLPAWAFPMTGTLLLVVGAALILWSHALLSFLAAILGLLAVLAGLGLLTIGHLLRGTGIPPLLAFLVGFLLIIAGILAFLRQDLIFDFFIYLAAGLGIAVGLLLIFIGSILPAGGVPRWISLGGGCTLLAAGLGLLLFPAAVSRLLLDLGGFAIAVSGCLIILISLPRRQISSSRP